MKNQIIIFLIILSNIAYSQTEQIEKESLSERYEKGEFSIETYKRYAKVWQKMITEIGGYPNLPYDETSGIIRFKEIQVTGQSLKINYNRVLEWAAITFGSLKNVLHYENLESGKIILKGVFDVTHKNEYKNFWGKSKEGITTTKCYQTYIFTIKDSTFKAEIVDVRYEFKSLGYNSTSFYVPDRIIEVSIHDIYPITKFESEEWKEKLDLLNQTNNRIKLLLIELKLYIMNYNTDYKF